MNFVSWIVSKLRHEEEEEEEEDSSSESESESVSNIVVDSVDSGNVKDLTELMSTIKQIGPLNAEDNSSFLRFLQVDANEEVELIATQKSPETKAFVQMLIYLGVTKFFHPSKIVETTCAKSQAEFLNLWRDMFVPNSSNSSSFQQQRQEEDHQPLFSTQDEQLVTRMDYEKHIDLLALFTLKHRIHQAGPQYMKAFCECGGVSVLIENMDNVNELRPLSRASAVKMYCLVMCLKRIIQANGVSIIVETRGAIDALTMAIDFNFKWLALEILEVLSVVCENSVDSKATFYVLQGINHLARENGELPFQYFLDNLKSENDMDVSVAIASFLNTVLLGDRDILNRAGIRNALETLHFSQLCQHVCDRTLDETINEQLIEQCFSKRRDSTIEVPPFQLTRDDSIVARTKEFLSTNKQHEVSGVGFFTLDENQESKSTSAKRVLLAPGKYHVQFKERSIVLFKDDKLQQQVFQLEATAINDMEYYSTIDDVQRFSAHSFRVNLATGAVLHVAVPEEKDLVDWSAAIQSFIALTEDELLFPAAVNCVLTTEEIELLYEDFSRQFLIYSKFQESDHDTLLERVFKLNPDPTQLVDIVDHQLKLKNAEAVPLYRDVLQSIAKAALTEVAIESSYWHSLLLKCKQLGSLEDDSVSKIMDFEKIRAENITLKAKIQAAEDLNTLAKVALIWKKREKTPKQKLKSALVALGRQAKATGKTIAELLPPYIPASEKATKLKELKESLKKQMLKDGFTTDEIYHFFNNAPANKLNSTNVAVTTTTKTLTATATPDNKVTAETASETSVPAVASKFAKYDKMKQMHLPEGAIRQKMAADGFKDKEIEAYMNGTATSPEVTSTSDSASAAVAVVTAEPAKDPRLEKYEKMKKMLPEAAVRQKMLVDGFKDDEIEAFLSGKPIVAAVAAAEQAKDPRLEKYEKMRAMNLPEGAIRQKMVADGFKDGEITAFFSGNSGGGKVAVPANPVDKFEEMLPVKHEHKPTTKLRSVFLSKLPPHQVVKTIWAKIVEKTLDWKDIEKKFGESKDTHAASKGSNQPVKDAVAVVATPKVAKPISLFDAKRAQQMSITLTAFRKSPRELLDLVTKLDPAVLSKEFTEKLIPILPTAEEIALVENAAPDANLDDGGKFVKEILAIPHLKQRLDVQLISFTWDENMFEVQRDVQIVINGISEIRKSMTAMEPLFSMCLTVVNYLNAGTARGKAHAVQLGTMAKLDTVKPTDESNKKLTLMHYVADLMTNHEKDNCEFFQEWIAVWDCPRVNIKKISESSLKELKEKLIFCKQELEESEGFEAKYRQPLRDRLELFLKSANDKVRDVEATLESLRTDITDIRVALGEAAAPELATDDPASSFFTLFVEAFRKYADALKQVNDWKELAARKERIRLAEETRKNKKSAATIVAANRLATTTITIDTTNNNAGSGLESPSTTTTSDVFEQRKVSKTLSAEEYIQRFAKQT